MRFSSLLLSATSLLALASAQTCPTASCDPIDPECTARRRRAFVDATPVEARAESLTTFALADRPNVVTVTVDAPLSPTEACFMPVTFVPGTADPSAYVEVNEHVAIYPGTNSGSVDITINADASCSSPKTFTVRISGDDCCDTGSDPIDVEVTIKPARSIANSVRLESLTTTGGILLNSVDTASTPCDAVGDLVYDGGNGELFFCTVGGWVQLESEFAE